jgi:hypothetical protein
MVSRTRGPRHWFRHPCPTGKSDDHPWSRIEPEPRSTSFRCRLPLLQTCRRGPGRGMGLLNALQAEDSELAEAEQGVGTADQPGLATKCQFSSVVGSLVLFGHRSLPVEIRPGRRGGRARRPPSRPRGQAGPSSGPVPLRGTCPSAPAPRRSPTPVRRARRRRCHHRS